MTNVYRGETPLRLGDRTFTLRLTTNVLARLEAELGATGFNLVQRLIGGGAEAMRQTFFACLVTPLERNTTAQLPKLDPEEMGHLMDDNGGYGADGIKQAYWLLLANADIIDRQQAEDGGLIPKGTGPKGEAGSQQDQAPHEMKLVTASAGV